MSYFNALYTVFSHCRTTQPFDERTSRVTVELGPQDRCSKVTRWAKWIVTSPVIALHGLYNIYLMAKFQELHVPVQKQVKKGNVFHLMPTVVPGQPTFHIVSSPKVLHALLDQRRNDPKGHFQGKIIAEVFLPLLQDLFVDPKDKRTKVKDNDFLFTCIHNEENSPVDKLRAPFETFVGPDQLPTFKRDFEKVNQEILKWISAQEKEGRVTISATELTEVLTVTVLSRLFLDLPGSFKDYQQIGSATTFVVNFQLMRKWSKPTQSQQEQYQKSLDILRKAIDSSKGPFVDTLRKGDLTLLQQKATLLLGLLAGSDTTASTLQGVLWHLGQGSCSFQDRLYKDLAESSNEANSKLKNLLSETLRLYSPADLISRYPNKDLNIKVVNKDGKTWNYFIWKGQGIMMSPFLAGRDPKLFNKSDSFDPDRFSGNGEHPNKPFSEGPHGCPGKYFARALMSSFIAALVEEYEILSFPNKPDLKMSGFITTKLEPVELTLTRRKK